MLSGTPISSSRIYSVGARISWDGCEESGSGVVSPLQISGTGLFHQLLGMETNRSPRTSSVDKSLCAILCFCMSVCPALPLRSSCRRGTRSHFEVHTRCIRPGSASLARRLEALQYAAKAPMAWYRWAWHVAIVLALPCYVLPCPPSSHTSPAGCHTYLSIHPPTLPPT